MMMRLPLILSLLITGSTAFAQSNLQSFQPSQTEMRQLPAYCVVRLNSKTDSPEWQMWRTQLGPNYIDTHHFCAGLNFLNRYYVARSKADKSGMLVAAKRNFEYMERAARPDFPLRADIYLHRGRTFKLMGQQGSAVSDFKQALTIDPKLTKAYLELMNIYANSKQKQKALETSVAGLKQIPDAKSLQRRYLELGGKLPFPQPDPMPPVAEIPKTDTAPESTPTSPEVKTDPATPGAPDPAALANPPTEQKPDEPAKPALGSPNNPYCRFCP